MDDDVTLPVLEPGGTRHIPSIAVISWLHQIWTDLLGPQDIDEDSDFFALGGQSLTAARLIAHIQQELKVQITLREFFACPTVRALAELIANAPPVDRRLGRVRPVLRPRGKYVVPLAPGQESYWRVEQAIPGSGMFNHVMRIEVLGRIDIKAVMAGLNDVVAGQEALRATFTGQGAHALQSIRSDPMIPQTRQICVAESSVERETLVRREVELERKHGFDLTSQLPIRARLLEFSQTDRVLIVTIHHIAFDGRSAQILLDELVEAYRARSGGRPAPPPPMPGYAEFAAWHAGVKSEGGFLPSIEFWRPLLTESCQELRLPGSSGTPGHQTRTLPVRLPTELGPAVSQLARDESTTPFTVLLAAFMVLLGVQADAREGRVALQVANRELAETQRLIGPFANTLVVRAPLDRETAFREFLHGVHGRALAAYEYQETPFDQVLVALGGQVDVARLLQVGFALHESAAPAYRVPGGTLRAVPPDETDPGKPGLDATTFELVVELRPEGGSWVGTITYKTGLYREQTAGAFVECYGRFLSMVTAHPDVAINAAYARSSVSVAP